VVAESVEIEQFERCSPDPHCPHCSGAAEAGAAFDWSFVDAIYCISLLNRPDRLATVVAEFHRVGLCRDVIFYRPKRHLQDPIVGIWESHSAVAHHACASGHGQVLVLEDDVRFTRALRPRRLRSIARAMATLPTDWRIFYLGHWAIRATFFRRGVLRTQSACTHAYVANRPALAWLAASAYQRTQLDHRWSRVIGRGLDAAFAALGNTYACFPLVAVQSASTSDHLRPERRGRIRNLRQLITHTRAREVLLSKLMIPNQFVVLLRSSCRPYGAE
jgi:GR25 family glycosyltransferase involved in LPS biosynthesis